MGDDARRTIGAHRVAIYPGSRGPAREADGLIKPIGELQDGTLSTAVSDARSASVGRVRNRSPVIVTEAKQPSCCCMDCFVTPGLIRDCLFAMTRNYRGRASPLNRKDPADTHGDRCGARRDDSAHMRQS